MLNTRAIFNLYPKNPVAKTVLDHMTLKGKNQEKFYVDVLAKELKLGRSDIIEVFKLLEKDCKMGSWLRGRVTPGQTRFEAVYRMDDVEKAMHNPKFEAPEPYRASPKRIVFTKKTLKQKKTPLQVAPRVAPVVEPLPVVKAVEPVATEPVLMNMLVIRPGFVLQIPSGLSEAERKKVADFVQIAN